MVKAVKQQASSRNNGSISLREQAYREIKKRILDSRFAPGSLLSENQLADELNISRTPVREALRDLASGGLVRVLPQRGIIVSDLTLQDAMEVYQLREQLESFAVRSAAEQMDKVNRLGFQSDHQQAVRFLKAGENRRAYDASILMHSRIIYMARNSRLTQIMMQLSDQTHRFGLLTLRHGRANAAIDEHEEIVEALVEGAADRAETLMRLHLRKDLDMVISLIRPAGIMEFEPPTRQVRTKGEPGTRGLRRAEGLGSVTRR